MKAGWQMAEQKLFASTALRLWIGYSAFLKRYRQEGNCQFNLGTWRVSAIVVEMRCCCPKLVQPAKSINIETMRKGVPSQTPNDGQEDASHANFRQFSAIEPHWNRMNQMAESFPLIVYRVLLAARDLSKASISSTCAQVRK